MQTLIHRNYIIHITALMFFKPQLRGSTYTSTAHAPTFSKISQRAITPVRMGRGAYDVTETQASQAKHGTVLEPPTASNFSLAQYVIDAHQAGQAKAQVCGRTLMSTFRN